MAVHNGQTGDGSGEKFITDGSTQTSKLHQRETWQRRFDFLLACVGASVGLGNVWRFPYLCYKNGGGAFLIPYFLCVLLGGIPMFFLEVAIGQFMGEGVIGAWKICPLLQGIGVASTILVFWRNVYYNIILAWTFYYLFASFSPELPWANCNNEWNTKTCRVSVRDIRPMNLSYIAEGTANMTLPTNTLHGDVTTPIPAGTDPATEYWQFKVLGISSGIDEPGMIKWDLALCLLLAWVVVYLCIIKGIKTSGKVMYITATSPYLLLFILLIRGCTLPGAWQGISFYIFPDWAKLADAQVWTDAGTQIFFSYSISLAQLTALGSYNKFNHNCFRDSLIYSVVNSGTSFLAGFVIFPVLGFMASEQGLSVGDVAESGPGLAFIAYPKAIAQLPFAPVWAILFFITLLLLGLDSQFVAVEGFVTAVVDEFAVYLRRGYRKEIFIAITCAVLFLCGLPMVNNGGIYVFQMFDYYLGSRVLLIIALFECLTLSYCYGARRFYDNLKMMLGFDPTPFMMVSWAAVTPFFTFSLLVLCFVSIKPLVYNRTYVYPGWSTYLGWSIGLSGVIMIPIVAGYRIIRSEGTLLQRIKHCVRPRLKPHQLRECDSPKDLLDYDPSKIYTPTLHTTTPHASVPVQYSPADQSACILISEKPLSPKD